MSKVKSNRSVSRLPPRADSPSPPTVSKSAAPNPSTIQPLTPTTPQLPSTPISLTTKQPKGKKRRWYQKSSRKVANSSAFPPITPTSPQLPSTPPSLTPSPDWKKPRPNESYTGPNEFGQTAKESNKLLHSRLASAAQESIDFNETAAQLEEVAAPTLPWWVQPPEEYPDSFLDKYIATCQEDDDSGDYEGCRGWGRLQTKLRTDRKLSGVCTINALLETLRSFFKEGFVDSVRRYYFGLVEEENAVEILNAYFSIFCIHQLEVLMHIFRMEFSFDERERQRKADEGGSKRNEGQPERGEDELGERVGLGGNDEGRGQGVRDSGMSEKVDILRDTNHVKVLRESSWRASPDTVKVTYEHMSSRKQVSGEVNRGEISAEPQETLQKRCASFEKAARDLISQDTKELGDTFNIGDSKSAKDEGLLFHSAPFQGFLNLIQSDLEPSTNTFCNLSTGRAFLLFNSIALAFSRAVLINPQVRDNFREPIVVLAFKVPRCFLAEERKGTLGGEEDSKKGGPSLSKPHLTKAEFLALREERYALADWIVEDLDEEENKGQLLSFVQTNLEADSDTRPWLSRPVKGKAPKAERVDVVIAPWIDPTQSEAGADLIAGRMFRATTTPGVSSLQVACTSRASMKKLLSYHYQNYEEDLDGLTVGPC